MAIPDSDLLDVVRRLRSYMSTMDNVHNTLNMAQEIEDDQIRRDSKSLLLDIPTLNTRVSTLLRTIESSRSYRDMIKKFNMKQEQETEEEEDNG